MTTRRAIIPGIAIVCITFLAILDTSAAETTACAGYAAECPQPSYAACCVSQDAVLQSASTFVKTAGLCGTAGLATFPYACCCLDSGAVASLPASVTGATPAATTMPAATTPTTVSSTSKSFCKDVGASCSATSFCCGALSCQAGTCVSSGHHESFGPVFGAVLGSICLFAVGVGLALTFAKHRGVFCWRNAKKQTHPVMFVAPGTMSPPPEKSFSDDPKIVEP